MISLFWKKLVLMNIGLFIIILRIYELSLSKFEYYILNKSIFPLEDEDGYPFLEQIDCNLKNLFLITYHLSNTQKGIHSNNFSVNIHNIPQCSYKSIFQLCKEDISCQHYIMSLPSSNNNFLLTQQNYHPKNNFEKGKIFWDYINSLNVYDKDVEMDFLHKILSGYHSYINLLLIKEDELGELKNKITSSYDNMNNLIYLQSLLYKAVNKLNSTYYQKELAVVNQTEQSINNKNISNFYSQCLNQSIDYLQFEMNNKVKENTFKILDNIEKVFACINNNDIKLSSIYDLRNIQTLFKVFFGYEVENEEKKSLGDFSIEFSKNLFKVFQADVELKTRSLNYQDYQQYFYIFFIGFIITVLLFTNRYFIKDRKNQNGKTFVKSKSYPNSDSMKQLKNKIKKEEETESVAKGIPYSKFSPLEQHYIDKLIKEG